MDGYEISEKLKKLDKSKIKVGDHVMYIRKYGVWNYNYGIKFHIAEVVKITPKRTKIYTANNVLHDRYDMLYEVPKGVLEYECMQINKATDTRISIAENMYGIEKMVTDRRLNEMDLVDLLKADAMIEELRKMFKLKVGEQE